MYYLDCKALSICAASHLSHHAETSLTQHVAKRVLPRHGSLVFHPRVRSRIGRFTRKERRLSFNLRHLFTVAQISLLRNCITSNTASLRTIICLPRARQPIMQNLIHVQCVNLWGRIKIFRYLEFVRIPGVSRARSQHTNLTCMQLLCEWQNIDVLQFSGYTSTKQVCYCRPSGRS